MAKKRLIIAFVSIFIVGLILGIVIDYACLRQENQRLGYPGLYAPIMGISSSGVFDSDGIVLAVYGGGRSKQYNPVTISEYALGNYHYYVSTGEKQYKEQFLKHADWLVDHQVITPEGFGVWYYNFDGGCLCKAPWISAMAQGEAISVLTRAYALTQDEKYLEAAKLSVGAFEHSVDEGGVRFIDEDGNVFYEECAWGCEYHPCILNGFIFSLFGLHDYYQTTGSEEALGLFNEGVETLKVRLKDYDTGEWSCYSLPELGGYTANETYHRLHCQQLFELYSITGEPQFLHYAEKWYSYMQQ